MTKADWSRFYCYTIYDADTDRPLYVGKGKNERCLQHLGRYDLRDIKRLYIEVTYCSSEEEAHVAEKAEIERIGMKNLLNKPIPGNRGKRPALTFWDF